MYVIAHPLLAIISILGTLLTLYSWVIIISALISWVNPDPYNPIVQILRKLTEPVYNRLRPYIPAAGSFDLTPIAVILIIMFIQRGILPIFNDFALNLM